MSGRKEREERAEQETRGRKVKFVSPSSRLPVHGAARLRLRDPLNLLWSLMRMSWSEMGMPG